ncbi:hypothetical protein DYB34_011092 [Aphanomyces astaci]|uniref:BZIP domain-containing protein n=1 Tax=Aphanomyces astaci TaxID=112090 RepID=A0A418BKH3_APHAT|nr:hypothetical protein DYB34_011092 [Aphanomyces astaci]
MDWEHPWMNVPDMLIVCVEQDMQVENADEDDMMDPVLSGLPSNLTRNLWDDWNEDNALQDDTTLANFASGMDMTYVDDKQPATSSSDALLDSLMAESNVKAENGGGFDDMMSPPTSVQNFTHQDVADMMLPPSAFGYNPAVAIPSKDTSDITSHPSASSGRPRRSSNPSPYPNNSPHPPSQYGSSSNGGVHGRTSSASSSSGAAAAPVSPPRESMANMPVYSPQAAASSPVVPTSSGYQHTTAALGGGNVFNPVHSVGGYSTMHAATHPSMFASHPPPSSSTNGSSAFGPTSFHMPSQHQQLQQSQHHGSGGGGLFLNTHHSGGQQFAPPPPSAANPLQMAQSPQGQGHTPMFGHPSSTSSSSSFGHASPYNNMMIPPGFIMYNQGPHHPMPPQHHPHHHGQQPSQQHFQPTAAASMMMNPFLNLPPSMLNGGGGVGLNPMPFSMGMPPPGGPSSIAAAKPPLKPHVPLARKPGTGEISSMLQSLLDEEAEKRDKKLERNRDSARESRKKQQKYVEVLEDGIQHLQIAKESLGRFRFGRSPPAQLDLLCGLRPSLPSFAVVMHASRQRRMLGHPKHPLLDKVFSALGRTLALLQASLLDMTMLWDAASNGLADVLRLSPTQQQQLDDLAAVVRRREMARLALLVKAFKVLRRRAFELGAFAPSLDVYFRAVLTPDQLAKMVTWTEMNRSDLLRLQSTMTTDHYAKPMLVKS